MSSAAEFAHVTHAVSVFVLGFLLGSVPSEAPERPPVPLNEP